MRINPNQATAPTASAAKSAPTKPLTAKDIAALQAAVGQGKMGSKCAAPADLTKLNKTQLQSAYPAVPGVSAARDEINVYQTKTAPQLLFIEDKSATGSTWTRMTKVPKPPVTHTTSSK
jgi:hypothetical protein